MSGGKKKQYTIGETFVGAGGAHIGFAQQGFVSRFYNDIEQSCIDTLLHNNPEIEKTSHGFIGSIVDIDTKTLLDDIAMRRGDMDVFFGGIVCKGFSLAGERSPNDQRNYYYRTHLEIIKTVYPKISIIENVPSMETTKVLSYKTPEEIRTQVDALWKNLQDHKGKAAAERKKGLYLDERKKEKDNLNKQKEQIMSKLEHEGYFVTVVDDIKRIYEEMGYVFYKNVLSSAWYGAATKRERLFLVAVRKDIDIEFQFPTPTHMSDDVCRGFARHFDSSSMKKVLTVNDALTAMDVKNMHNPEKDIDNQPMQHKPKTVERFTYIPEGRNIQDVIDQLPKELEVSKFYSRGSTMRLAGNKPSPTLVPGHSNFPVHPKEHRSITVREAAMISGFPNDYKFIGNHCKRCEHVGNAVTPPLASALARSCNDVLDKYYKSNKDKNSLFNWVFLNQ